MAMLLLYISVLNYRKSVVPTFACVLCSSTASSLSWSHFLWSDVRQQRLGHLFQSTSLSQRRGRALIFFGKRFIWSTIYPYIYFRMSYILKLSLTNYLFSTEISLNWGKLCCCFVLFLPVISPDSCEMVWSDAADFPDTLCVLTQHATHWGGF